jgi:hypothetical protein
VINKSIRIEKGIPALSLPPAKTAVPGKVSIDTIIDTMMRIFIIDSSPFTPLDKRDRVFCIPASKHCERTQLNQHT